MGLQEDLARAKEERVKPVLVDIAIGDTLYQVEARRLDGMQWAAVMASAPPVDEGGARLGFTPRQAALVACREYGRLFDAEGEHVKSLGLDDDGNPIPVDWTRIFAAISGVEVQAIASVWWALNAGDPNQKVVELKKALRGGSKTS